MKKNLRGFEVSRLSLSGICVKTRTSSKWRNVFDHLLCLNVSGFLFSHESFKTFVLDRSDNDRWWYESDEMTWEWENWHFTTTILKFILMFTSDNFSLSLSMTYEIDRDDGKILFSFFSLFPCPALWVSHSQFLSSSREVGDCYYFLEIW